MHHSPGTKRPSTTLYLTDEILCFTTDFSVMGVIRWLSRRVNIAGPRVVSSLTDHVERHGGEGDEMLEVACRHCDRRGQLRIARLIAEHRRDDYGDQRQLIAHGCTKVCSAGVDLSALRH